MYESHSQQLRKIGFGQCGLILESPGERHLFALKLCRPGFSDGLWTDCVAHSQIMEAFRSQEETDRALELLVPNIYTFVAGEDKIWWNEHRALVPFHEGTARNSPVLLLLPARTWLTDRRIPDALQNTHQRKDSTRSRSLASKSYRHVLSARASCLRSAR